MKKRKSRTIKRTKTTNCIKPVNQQKKSEEDQQKKKIFKYLTPSVIIALTVLLLGNNIGPRVVSWIKNKNSRPSIEININELELSPNNNNEIIYGYPTNEGNDMVLARFPISINNISNMTLENLQVHIRYPSIVKLAIDTQFLDISESNAIPDTIHRTYREYGNFDMVSFYLPDLNPKQAIEIAEQIRIINTHYSGILEANEIDGLSNDMTISFDYLFDVMITVSAKNMEPYDCHISLGSFYNESIEGLRENYKEIVNNKKREKRKELSFGENIILSLFDPKETTYVLLIYPNYQSSRYDDILLFEDSGQSERALYILSE